MKPVVYFCCVLAAACASGPARAATLYGLDTNGNGLSDLYELKHPGLGGAELDADGDGQSNAEEAAAGTNPLDVKSLLNMAAIVYREGEMEAAWQGVPGKRYQLQSTTGLGDESWADQGPARLGVGSLLEETAAAGSERMFLRLTVADTDSDGDGVTDYEEHLAKTNPLDGDTDHDGVYRDREMLSGLLNGTSVVTVIPGTARVSESGDEPGTFIFTRRGSLRPLTVAFTVGGTATPAADYTLSSQASVFFDVGDSTVTVTVTPVADAVVDPNETVTLSLVPAPGFSEGAPAAAPMVLEDSASPDGQGLLGQYYNHASTTYSSPDNFNPADLKFTRLDPQISFDWGSGTRTRASPMPPPSACAGPAGYGRRSLNRTPFTGRPTAPANSGSMAPWSSTSGTTCRPPAASSIPRRFISPPASAMPSASTTAKVPPPPSLRPGFLGPALRCPRKSSRRTASARSAARPRPWPARPSSSACSTDR